MTQKNRRIAARSLAKFSLFALIIFVISGWGVWNYLLSSPKKTTTPISLTISPGTSALAIGNLLYSEGLIRSPRVFQLYVRLSQLTLQAGDYSLVPSNMTELANTLTQGKKNEVKLTIPEGYRREQIAELVEAKLGIRQIDFLSATKSLEGTLFPDTYFFEKDATVEEIISIMTDNFAKKASKLNLTKDDIILASIVEREALTVEEKPVVAGILKNRLSDGWALEVDATIQYIMGNSKEWWPIPLLGDRKRISAYNTYINRGLPPSAIGNPGLVALDAVANPKSTPYYFYLHDKTGLIHYAATNAEHEANIAKYIR